MYLLRSFFYYFVLLTAGFILLFEVFTFFELLDDIAQHRTGLLDVINYFIYSGQLSLLSACAAGRAGGRAGHARRDDEK